MTPIHGKDDLTLAADRESSPLMLSGLCFIATISQQGYELNY